MTPPVSHPPQTSDWSCLKILDQANGMRCALSPCLWRISSDRKAKTNTSVWWSTKGLFLAEVTVRWGNRTSTPALLVSYDIQLRTIGLGVHSTGQSISTIPTAVSKVA